jgi:para-nitrobenzyl esterase
MDDHVYLDSRLGDRPGIGAAKKRPVMVWLHGGGYSSGTASSLMYDGTNLSQRGDVVMVGINHRLNVFGYTHFGDIGGPEYAHSGNAGQLDIISALEWIRDNIEFFGGDPKRVMIFGESGGGSKVSMLLGSPPAKGLFHRAVIESGPGVRMAERETATRAAETLLSELGFDAKRLPEIQKLSTEKILAAYFSATAVLSKRGTGGRMGGGGFSPVLDPQVLPAHPFHPEATRISEDVPVMVGWNKTESTVFSMGDPSVFSLDDAGLRKRIEGVAGNDADELIKAYRNEYPAVSLRNLFLHFELFHDGFRLCHDRGTEGRPGPGPGVFISFRLGDSGIQWKIHESARAGNADGFRQCRGWRVDLDGRSR